jgi:hypothetical protein
VLLSLPRRQAQPQTPRTTAPGLAGVEMADTPLILNVDDREPSRYARAQILRQHGFAVVEATTGQEALAAARELRPAAMLMDSCRTPTAGISAAKSSAIPSCAGSASCWSRRSCSLSKPRRISTRRLMPSWPSRSRRQHWSPRCAACSRPDALRRGRAAGRLRSTGGRSRAPYRRCPPLLRSCPHGTP